MKAVSQLFFFGILTFLSSCKESPSSHQTLHLNLFCEPQSLDPRKAADATSINVIISLFEGLTRFDFDNKPKQALAEKIEISHDKKVYTITLREAYWADGLPITAFDFVYAWQSLLHPKFPSPFAYKLFLIKNAEAIKKGKLPPQELGVKAINSKTLQINLLYPAPYFLELLAFPTFFPVPEHIAKKNENWSLETRSFVGNGPFRLKSWHHEKEMTLEKNPLYWDEKKVQLEKVHFLMIDDTTTELYLFEQGTLDWAGSPLSNLPLESITPLKEQGVLISYPLSAVYYYKVNTTLPPLSNKNFRKALAYSIQRQEIVDHILQSAQKIALGLVPPMPVWQESSICFRDGDIEKAQALLEKSLEEMDLSRSDLPEITLSYNANREHEKIAQVIQRQWGKYLGLQVVLETVEWGAFLSKIHRLDYQVGRSGWTCDFQDPLSFLQMFQKGDQQDPSMNETGWRDPYFDALLEKACYETDEKKRVKLLKQAESFLMDEMPVIPLFFIVFNYVKKPYVQKVYLSPLGTVDYKWASIAPTKKAA